MRNLLMPFAALAMLIATPATLPTPAAAQDNNEALAFCRSVIGPAPQPRNRGTLGECVSIFTVPDDGFAAHLCDFWLENDLLDDFDYDTYSECVRGEREFIRG